MKIEIKNTNDFSFTGYEENFLEVLQTHTLFEQFVNEIREILGISKIIEAGQTLPELDERKQENLKNLAVLLVGIYEGLPEDWHEIFANIIMTGTASPLESNSISISLEDNAFTINESDEKELKIVVSKRIKFNQLVKFINKHKLELDKLLKELPVERDTKMSYIGIIQELVRLKKENPNKSHKDLVELYEKNHILPLPTTLVDYNSFNTYYNRYKKIRNRLLKTSFQGIEILKSTLFNIKEKVSS
ncbi:MAG: hypothetical protein AAB553_05890 [Patescibacteria group bacterium]